MIKTSIINLHNMDEESYHLVSLQKEVKKYIDGLGIMLDASCHVNHTNIIKKNTEFALKLYEKGFNGLDLISLIERNMITSKNIMNHEKKFEFLITFNKIRKEFRNEKTLMLFILHFMFLSLEYNLENISFM
jgi:hypothetical protein